MALSCVKYFSHECDGCGDCDPQEPEYDECAECGAQIKDGDYYYTLDGKYYCQSCVDAAGATRHYD